MTASPSRRRFRSSIFTSAPRTTSSANADATSAIVCVPLDGVVLSWAQPCLVSPASTSALAMRTARSSFSVFMVCPPTSGGKVRSACQRTRPDLPGTYEVSGRSFLFRRNFYTVSHVRATRAPRRLPGTYRDSCGLERTGPGTRVAFHSTVRGERARNAIPTTKGGPDGSSPGDPRRGAGDVGVRRHRVGADEDGAFSAAESDGAEAGPDGSEGGAKGRRNGQGRAR